MQSNIIRRGWRHVDKSENICHHAEEDQGTYQGTTSIEKKSAKQTGIMSDFWASICYLTYST